MPAWTFGAVGDVFINRPDPVNAFRDCAPLLRQIDVLFGNCEGAFTNRPHYAPSAGWRVVADEENGRGLQDAGFHVMACANNHILDAGHEGLADTLRLLREQKIRTVGAGNDMEEAHAPAFAERAGLRVGFLAYASVYQAGYEARKRRAGPRTDADPLALLHPRLGCLWQSRARSTSASSHRPVSRGYR